MTYYGGVNGRGCIFLIDTSGKEYKKLLDFDNKTGENPVGSLMPDSAGLLYGMTKFGGQYDSGCIFSIDHTGGGYKILVSYDGTSNVLPLGTIGLENANENKSAFSFADKGITTLDFTSTTGTVGVYPEPGNGKFNIHRENNKLFIVNYQLSVFNNSPLGQNSGFVVRNTLGVKNIEIYGSQEVIYTSYLKTQSAKGDWNEIDLSNQQSGDYSYRIFSQNGEIIGEGRIAIINN
jgi:uncharacterized repeat protein (TIGR03803 family)